MHSDPNPERYLPDIPGEIQDLLFDGRKIEAIKVMREKTGMSLSECKREIEKIQELLKQAFPDRVKANPKSGCAACFVLMSLVSVLFFLLRI